MFEVHAEPEIDVPKKARLEALENHLVPDDPRLVKPPPFVGQPSVVDLNVVDDVENLRRPALLPRVPPCIIIIIRDTCNSLKRELDPRIALPLVRPTKHPDQFEP